MTALANKGTIERLYAAFADRNGAAMTACYAPGAHFRDPAFGDLEGDDIGAMWRMLTGRARDLEITLREHEADERAGTAHWLARYTFSTGRPVENDIQARFTLRPGRPDHRPRRRLRLSPVGEPGPRSQRPPGRPAAAVARQGPRPGAGPAHRLQARRDRLQHLARPHFMRTYVRMRWDEQRVEKDMRLPGVGDGTVVRTFDAPEAMGINFHEVRARSALNHVPGESFGFSWTINPYRGCTHACVFCLDGGTPILLADGRSQADRRRPGRRCDLRDGQTRELPALRGDRGPRPLARPASPAIGSRSRTAPS